MQPRNALYKREVDSINWSSRCSRLSSWCLLIGYITVLTVDGRILPRTMTIHKPQASSRYMGRAAHNLRPKQPAFRLAVARPKMRQIILLLACCSAAAGCSNTLLFHLCPTKTLCFTVSFRVIIWIAQEPPPRYPTLSRHRQRQQSVIALFMSLWTKASFLIGLLKTASCVLNVTSPTTGTRYGHSSLPKCYIRERNGTVSYDTRDVWCWARNIYIGPLKNRVLLVSRAKWIIRSWGYKVEMRPTKR